MTIALLVALILLGYLSLTGRTADTRDVRYSLRPHQFGYREVRLGNGQRADR
jgi:hypothetical protein